MPAPFPHARFSISLFFLVFLLARAALAEPQAAERATGETPPPAAHSIIEQARDLVERGEALGEEGLDKELQEMAAQLAAYREAHPDDAQSWILAARVGRLIHMAQPQIWRGDHLEADMAASEAEDSRRLAELHSFLDRALGHGRLDRGLLDPTWFGEDVEFRTSDRLDTNVELGVARHSRGERAICRSGQLFAALLTSHENNVF